MAVSLKHATLTTESPTGAGGTVGATEWDADHDVPIASQAEAEAGTSADKLMTPQRTAQAIAALGGGGGGSSPTGILSHVGGAAFSGAYYSNRGFGTGTTFVSPGANAFHLGIYVSPFSFTADLLTAKITTANGNMKFVVYDGDDNGFPGTLLFESASISAASTGIVSASCSISIAAQQNYWLGIRVSGTAGYSALSSNYGWMIKQFNNDPSASPYNMIARTLSFATAAPSSFGMAEADVSAWNAPLVAVRAA